MMFRVAAINRHRMATDGVGVTTLVALQGCPLHCKYCINDGLIKSGKYLEVEPAKLLEKLMADYCYFAATGGGITLGGGEPLLQSEAILELAGLLPEEVHLTIETSLNVADERVAEVLKRTDALIIDTKSIHPEIYQAYTRCNNENTLKWLAYICEHHMQDKCTLRIPHIPGYTTEADILSARTILTNMGFTNLDVFEYRVA